MRSTIRELFETIILALVIFLGLQFSMGNYRVEGSSMSPTLKAGEYLLVNKLVYTRIERENLPFVDPDENADAYQFERPKRGDVIIFEFPNNPERDFVKRVIGIPGDIVEIHEGQVWVNEIPINEPYVTHRDSRYYYKQSIPSGFYYVLGDNRMSSNDSRDWGLVPVENIIGKAWVRFWPLDRLESIKSQITSVPSPN